MVWSRRTTARLLINSSSVSQFFIDLLLVGHSFFTTRYMILSYASTKGPVGARWLATLLVIHSDLVNSIIFTAAANSTTFHLTENQLAKGAVAYLITSFVLPKGTL